MVTNEQLAAFCGAVAAKIIDNLGGAERASRVHNFKGVDFVRGAKFAKIVVADGQLRVHSFVDLENGNILKAGTWKAPEPKRHVRGNIANGAADVTPYGAVYLK